FTRAAIQDLQLKIADRDHFASPITVDIVDLKRSIVREQAVARIGLAMLPQYFPRQRDRRQATDLVKRVAAIARNILRDHHLGYAVAIQVAEAYVSPGAEHRRIELAPQLRFRIVIAQPFELGITLGHTRLNSPRLRIRGRHTKILKARRTIG